MPSIDIDIDDFYYECTLYDKHHLVTKLQDEGYLEEEGLRDSNDHGSAIDEEWREVMQKLLDNRVQLTMEQEDLIKSIVSKIV